MILPIAIVACAFFAAKRAWSLSTAEMVANAKPALVFVHYRDCLNRHSTGTGFLISQTGTILTCYHVVEPALSKPRVEPKIWVRICGGATYEATREADYEESDLSVLDIPGDNHPCLSVERLRQVQQGEEVLVLGYPLGEALGKELVVTRGIISSIRLDGTVLQLDAATNPGSSGGPVLDAYGKVVGIAWAKLTSYEGTNFAISALSLPPVPVGRVALVTSGKTTIYARRSSTSKVYSICDKGVPLAVIDESHESWYGVLMIDGSTGWVEAAKVKLLDRPVELN